MATHTPMAGKLNTEITTGTRELDPARQSAARLAAETLMCTLDPTQGHTFYQFLQESRVGRNEIKDKAETRMAGVLKVAHDNLRNGLWDIADMLTDSDRSGGYDIAGKIEALVGKRRDVGAAVDAVTTS